jgi:hypothetical protein
VLDAPTGLQRRDDLVLLEEALAGDDERDVAPDGLLGGIAE